MIFIGGENDGQKVAAATYLKNFTRQNIKGNGPNSKVSKEFKDCLMRILLQVEPAIMKVLIEVVKYILNLFSSLGLFLEYLIIFYCYDSKRNISGWQFRIIVVAEFVEQNSWPELVPELRSAIWSSNLINNGTNYEWNTTNALTVFQALIRPFQVLIIIH